MSQQTLTVDGMTCNHCVETIENSLKALEGVDSVQVDLESKTVKVGFDENKTKIETISEKIVEVGFEVV